MKLISTMILVITIVLLGGCSTRTAPHSVVTKNAEVELDDIAAVKQQLYRQHKQWQGVKYRIGGLSKSGIDCSGFVHVTYRSKLGVTLPRTTKLQSDLGRSVKQHDLKAGDLVFFKTGLFVRHVGIYVEKRRFLHASTSRGVTISSLDNPYWRSKYWKARRIR
jgi:cell wall-associated NlpC family hydrolase